ncbi:phosphate ABC transporter, periplasmic phosphate-binding protein [Desulfurobacterium thermolithotrophum DSM 11699]|uniref:Phosphate-binding protein n=1 Tax=Desulfurobacterium thermolithotrophum (strain DSM 11699 / BSA) TaxID=868864 RepID=F0S448_DESTD|nr:phosphate ABC transporter substrate-binding protein PstS [Desulfurobacterium thermolithotrophum]ADY73620.1 phosphate ABC transporter, periplasmic phosphate-binding protein [Desulfurobacterium thermolithotrophum DSM 11699]
MFKTTRRKLMFIAAGLVSSVLIGSQQVNAGSNTINGAGATFPYPVYVKWAKEYKKATGIRVNYQGIGSGGGIRQITARVVDFGGSDKMLSPVELEKRKLYQFPAVIGSIVVVYNLPGVGDGELKLSNKAVSEIFMGKIKYWDNPLIRKDNPTIKLPHMRITVVHRSEGSGTTWNFTYWLSHICSDWKEKIGYGKVVNWPTGMGAKGNAGVSAYVRRIPGAIGYVEYAYKLQNHLKAAQLQTTAGNFIKPTEKTFKAAASHASMYWESHFYNRGNILLAAGENSWPLTVATMILLPKEKMENNKRVVDFFNWAFENGDRIASELGYVPLPESVKKEIRKYWKEVVFEE